MDVAAIIVLGVALIVSGATNLYLAIKLASSKDAESDARALAAQREGEATLDARKVDDANTATVAAVAAAKKQEARGDALEKGIADAPTVGSGFDRLRVLSQAPAALPDPGPGPGKGGPGPV